MPGAPAFNAVAGADFTFDQKTARLWALAENQPEDETDDNIRVSSSYDMDIAVNLSMRSERLRTIMMNEPTRVGLAKYQEDTLQDEELDQEGKISESL